MDQNLYQHFKDFGQTSTTNKIYKNHVRVITQRILQCLRYFHCNNIIHLDLKPTNIMVNNNGVVKLIDFGFA